MLAYGQAARAGSRRGRWDVGETQTMVSKLL